MGNEIGGPSRGRAMINAQGISLILKSIELRFKRPVTYPDTVSTTSLRQTGFFLYITCINFFL